MSGSNDSMRINSAFLAWAFDAAFGMVRPDTATSNGSFMVFSREMFFEFPPTKSIFKLVNSKSLPTDDQFIDIRYPGLQPPVFDARYNIYILSVYIIHICYEGTKIDEFLCHSAKTTTIFADPSTGYADEKFRLWRASRTAVAFRGGGGGVNPSTRWPVGWNIHDTFVSWEFW